MIDIRYRIDYAEKNCTVDVHMGMNTVLIEPTHGNYDSIELNGDDSTRFINDANALTMDYPSLTIAEAYLNEAYYFLDQLYSR